MAGWWHAGGSAVSRLLLDLSGVAQRRTANEAEPKAMSQVFRNEQGALDMTRCCATHAQCTLVIRWISPSFDIRRVMLACMPPSQVRL